MLIRDLVQTGRYPATGEIDQISLRISEAPFPDLLPHLARRLIERQWALGTTGVEYLEALRRAARDQEARISAFRRRGGYLAAVLIPTDRVIPAHRRGTNWLPLLFVVYSADRGIILTGYQTSSLGAIALPEDIRWLR